MLLLTGMVFKSATDASGQSMAYQEILQQARAMMLQLDQDFRGLRPDLPMAIIFEGYDWYTDNDLGDFDPEEDKNKVIRYDRIVFFADGNFENFINLKGNVARIFYGQSLDNEFPSPDMDISSPRRILSRRMKILTAGNYYPPDDSYWNPDNEPRAVEHDGYDMEQASLAFWKNAPMEDYRDNYFRVPDYQFAKNTWITKSFLRRPYLYSKESNDTIRQQMYLLPDVTDFRIEAWDDSQGFWSSWVGGVFYWNIPDMDIVGDYPKVDNLDWISEHDLKTFGISHPWPEALKFTFTLYDKGRRYFPEGVTFEYIVKLPPRP